MKINIVTENIRLRSWAEPSSFLRIVVQSGIIVNIHRTRPVEPMRVAVQVGEVEIIFDVHPKRWVERREDLAVRELCAIATNVHSERQMEHTSSRHKESDDRRPMSTQGGGWNMASSLWSISTQRDEWNFFPLSIRDLRTWGCSQCPPEEAGGIYNQRGGWNSIGQRGCNQYPPTEWVELSSVLSG